VKTFCVVMVLLLMGHGSQVIADDPKGVRWTFEDAHVGQLPEGWSAAKTGTGKGSVWKIVEDATAPAGRNVLAQTSAEGPNALFNLGILDEGTHGDVQISVSFKAVAGKIDQGGGPIWRYQDENNYYICRHNPLENNFRIYRVIDGKRTQLASADVQAEAGTWHTISVTMKGDKITCAINGKKLEVRDDTIAKPGKVGLWTKADAVTHFDDFQVTSVK